MRPDSPAVLNLLAALARMPVWVVTAGQLFDAFRLALAAPGLDLLAHDAGGTAVRREQAGRHRLREFAN